MANKYRVCVFAKTTNKIRDRVYYNVKKDKFYIYQTFMKENSYAANKWKKDHPKKYRAALKKRSKENRGILKILKSNGCAICGYNKCDRALEFHHVNPKDKKYLIRAAEMGREDLAEEIRKCILLCANCHREIHDKEGD